MALLQPLQAPQKSGMDPQQLMQLIGMMAAAGGGAPGAGVTPPPSMEGMMPPSGMMPTPQGASMAPPTAPPALGGMMPQTQNLGLAAGPSSPASPSASLMPPAYNRPAPPPAPMSPQQVNDQMRAQEMALQAQDDALQAGSPLGKKPDYQKAAGLLGQMNQQMSGEEQMPAMSPLSRGTPTQVQAAASPLVNSGGGYREMLMKLAQGRYG